MKHVAFLLHKKSFERLINDTQTLNELGVKIIILSNCNKVPNKNIIYDHFYEVDLNDTVGVAALLSQYNIAAVVTPTDHLITKVVDICELLNIEPPCDYNTANIFMDKLAHHNDMVCSGLSEYTPSCAIVKNLDELLNLSDVMPGQLFIKPTISCGMVGLFPNRIDDDFLFEYKGLADAAALIKILIDNELIDTFISYCIEGIHSPGYYPEFPKALIQNCYHTNKSYTVQYTVLNGEWMFNSIGRVFYAPSIDYNYKIDPYEDPRNRVTTGDEFYSLEIGYYHIPRVPDHIASFLELCINYMKERYTINNLAFGFAIHETIDGKFYMTDLGPRCGGQWKYNHKFSQPDYYFKFWKSVLYKEKHTFHHAGKVGCVNTVFLEPGEVTSYILPDDDEHLIIMGREDLYVGRNIPAVQSMNSKSWGLKIYTCGDDMDEQWNRVLANIKYIRNNITYK